MGDIIAFRPRSLAGGYDELGIDLHTAVDAAIRDLREIVLRWGEESARLQLDECRIMLEQAFEATG